MPAGEEPFRPPDLDVMLWYDMSPMRPDEYMQTNAYRWHEALTLRNAYHDGYQDARREHETQERLLNMRPQA